MRIEPDLASKKGKQQLEQQPLITAPSEKKPDKAASKNKKRQKKPPPMQTAIQKLFDTCKDVFSDSRPGFVPSPAAVKLLGSVLVQPHEIKLAKVKSNAVYTAPCDTSILYPAEGGNIHCFTAVTPVAVLDVLGPPYSDKEGRDCTYYSSFPYPSFSGGDDLINGDIEGHEWLEERKKPEDFIVVGARYKGPKFVEK
ncbi:hypothetical protein QJS10_CPA10g00605 [Acorus calamus]|uniref:cysteine dioxygenase n=1 Tax=Acorus calamus TaxID=4465 RepID=A0AAV9DXG8_ACOCL|nr:hypothetical protein QJS10_CPA10g00605 [Acorus calamus]